MLTRTAGGYYQPSHFFIHIDSEEDFDELLLNNQQTFEHEYIHFLQDIILPYCIRTNMTTISKLACVNTYAYQHKEIVRPFIMWNEDCKITKEQLKYDTCKDLLLNLGWSARGHNDESIFIKRKRRLNDFRDWLTNLFSHRQFSDIKKWVEFVSNYVEMNLSNGFIISELYLLNYEEFRVRIDKIANDVGIPMIFNKNNLCISSLPEGYEREQFLQFFVM